LDGFLEHFEGVFDDFKKEIELFDFLEEEIGHGGEEFFAFTFEVVRQWGDDDTLWELA
jgi:hypothetical protein